MAICGFGHSLTGRPKFTLNDTCSVQQLNKEKRKQISMSRSTPQSPNRAYINNQMQDHFVSSPGSQNPNRSRYDRIIREAYTQAIRNMSIQRLRQRGFQNRDEADRRSMSREQREAQRTRMTEQLANGDRNPNFNIGREPPVQPPPHRHEQMSFVFPNIHMYLRVPNQPILAPSSPLLNPNPDPHLQHFPISCSTGLNRQQFSLLPRHSHSGKQEICPICLDDIVVGDQVLYLVCLHQYHIECCAKWLRNSVLCPVCKTDIRKCLNS